ncbi:MAG: hypothetical protein DDT32_01910 [Syntrophomonadaceae bacterium]|nr:hypothetical protein [Bacillota bacterium]
MALKSHTKAELETYATEAAIKGEPLGLWKLDTGNDGDDDVLFGSYQGVVSEILAYHELDELPSHWTLEPWKLCWID